MAVKADKQKPRVLILLDRLVIGGQAVDIVPLAFYLKEEFEIKLLYGQKKTEDTDADYLLQLYPGIETIQIPSLKQTNHWWDNWQCYLQISKEIKYFKPDVLHTNAVKSGVIGRLAAYLNNVPVIIHTYHGHFFHSYFNKIVTIGIVFIEKLLNKITNIIIATSESQLVDFVYSYKVAPLKKVKVVSLGIDDRFINAINSKNSIGFKERYGIGNDSITIGIIARIVKIKNFNLFVDVVTKVLQRVNRKITFIVIGDGNMKKEVQKQLESNNILWSSSESIESNADVIFTSWLPYISEALNNIDIMMLTSNNEGTGLSLAESQFVGKPVVATKVGGIPDTIIDGKTGFLIRPNDVDDFSKKLLMLIENDTLRIEMGLAAKNYAQERFSKLKEVETITKVYKTSLENFRFY